MDEKNDKDFKQFLDECRLQKERRLAIIFAHVKNGVEFPDPEHTYVDETVVIGRGTRVFPGVRLEGTTVIGENCLIGDGCRIENSAIGAETQIRISHILDSHIGNRCNIGPFAYVRPGCRIGDGVKIGDFVEVKNSVIGEGTKVPHLTYVGDADLGSGINLGCGVIFVNYDGSVKHRSTVGDGAFVGCNTNLISPVTVGENAYIAAGSTITRDVPPGALAVARARQENVPGWVEKRGLLKKKER